jgi:leucyl aminopeptidase
MALPLGDPTRGATPVILTTRAFWPRTKSSLSAEARAFATAAGFDAAPGAHLILPDAKGGISAVLFALAEPGAGRPDRFLPGRLANLLPRGRYRIEGDIADHDLAALGFLLSAYKFSRYRKSRAAEVILELPRGAGRSKVETIAEAVTMGRDLINTPANDMGPQALETAALALARKHGARAKVVHGAELEKAFPLVHAVGKGAAEAPRLVDFRWGARNPGPKVTLVGKGVCFDTGGLDIKPDAAMLLMKKDMGGAATALAAASMIMQARLPVRLRVIVPIVENSVSAQAFRPGDVYSSRAGLTVEIGNTDAEGRLILADALALADEDQPDLLFDFATLTGAARVALGPDLPAMFCGDDALADEILRAGEAAVDPAWRLPLWSPYDSLIEGKTADLNNVSGGSFAGAIVAALFLQRFVAKSRAAWAHFDVYNWNQSAKPGRPEGGDIQAARLVFELLQRRVAKLAPARKKEINTAAK